LLTPVPVSEATSLSIVRIPVPASALEFSGERFTSAVEGEVRHEHYHRYLFSLQFCAGQSVLDIASGEGYGSALIASVARQVTGVDISPQAVDHANRNYGSRNLSFRVGDVCAIPAADASFDVVVSFETIEHVTSHVEFLEEIRRVLKPGGILLMSSPNKDVYSAAGEAANPFHLKELNAQEFQDLLISHFRHTAFLRQSSVQGSVVSPDAESRHSWGIEGFRHLHDNLFESSAGLPSAMYLIGVASDAHLPKVLGGSFDDRPFQLGLYAEMQRRHIVMLQREAEIRRIEAGLVAKDTQLQQTLDRERKTLAESETMLGSIRTLRIDQAKMQAEIASRDAQLTEISNREKAALAGSAALRTKLRTLEEEIAIHQANARRDTAELAVLRSDAITAVSQANRFAEERMAFQKTLAGLESQIEHLAKEREDGAAELYRTRERLRLATEAHAAERDRQRWELGRKIEEAEKTGVLLAKAMEDVRRFRSKSSDSERERLLTIRALVGARVLNAEAESLRTAAASAEAENRRLGAELDAIRSSVLWRRSVRLRSLLRIEPRLGPATTLPEAAIPCPSLFDRDWYLQRNDDVRAAGIDPWEHFLSHGASERRSPHPLFDTSWYLESNLDVAAAGVNPLLHFQKCGGVEGRSPHPLFDSRYYLAENPDVCEAGMNPLVHYLAHGSFEGRSPHPLFDPTYYRKSNADVDACGLEPLTHYVLKGGMELAETHPLFDTEYYISGLATVPANPLIHFLRSDRASRPAPHPLFDTRYYVAANQDVARQAIEPLIHFVRFGEAEGRNPHPLFDAGFYLARHPDYETARLNPLTYYLNTGASLHVDPHPLFDTDFYLAQLPDPPTAGLAPLVHYLTCGAGERCSPHPLFDVDRYLSALPEGHSVEDPLLHYLAGDPDTQPDPHALFDSKYYLDCNHDVRATRENPLLHYVRDGGWEGRDPHPLFGSAWYLKRYPDVLAARINPLAHWARFGANEGRDPHPLFDTSYYREHAGDLDGLNPLIHYFRSGARAGTDPHPLFRTSYYSKRNPDVASAGVNPLAHFLWTGMTEKRDPHPAFSCSYYMEQCPDVEKSRMNPLIHYLECGAALRLNPEPRFDTNFYIETNPEVAAGNLNPLVHYITNGRANGRAPHPAFATALQPVAIELSPPDQRELIRQRRQAAQLVSCGYQPLISVLLPVYDTPPRCLKLAIQSVVDQLYGNWELCIQDDGSQSEATRLALHECAKLDSRIRVAVSGMNEGISRATNRALEQARGEFVAFLDHDDELTPGALAEVVQELNRDPSLDVVYTDQEYIDEDGSFSGDFFKPRWSPYLFRGVMYVGHLLVTRRDLALSVGGCDPRFDFVQDFEFMLRLSESTEKIAHIPHVLYRWRRIPGSVASGSDEKPGIEALQAAAVNAHFARVGIAAEATSNPSLPHRLKIHSADRESWPPVTAVLTHADDRMLESARLALEDHSGYPDLRILVKPLDELLIKLGELDGFVLLIDAAVRPASPNWIQELMLYADRPDVAAVGALVLNADHVVESAGLIVDSSGRLHPAMAGFDSRSDGYAGSLACAREVSALPDHCLLISVQKLLRLGLRIEYLTGLYRVADLTVRASQAGLRNILNPRAVVRRRSDAVKPPFDSPEDRALFREMWRDAFSEGDPYHNPNFGDSNFAQPR
jgi:SAM-dependent methyltransferase/GT2 family glycosyltransferase